ncbi:MAG TPA: hypothetical protein VE198_03270 [Actinoallomurus sp.]|nr:hypothetical protein [Actinoallomurus sp.]
MSSEEVEALTAHAGEKAQKIGDFCCAQCDEKVHVKQGEKIPRCPNGHTGFETRRHEPDTKS